MIEDRADRLEREVKSAFVLVSELRKENARLRELVERSIEDFASEGLIQTASDLLKELDDKAPNDRP